MKKCEYCAKEISYHEMYCSDDCQKKANDFYDLREKFSMFFSVINGICVIAIGICIFAYAFLPYVGVYGAAAALIILGIMYFFLPFPPEVMISKHKIKKSVKISRIIAIVLLVLGIAVALFGVFTLK